MTWSTISLRRIVTCLDGRRIPLNSGQRSEIPGNIPYWGAGGVADMIDASIFDEPLVLLGEDGAPFFTPGKDVAHYIEGPSWINNHIHALRPVSYEGRYLAYALNAVDYAKYITGATRDKLTQDDLKKINVPNPPRADQRRIADFLDSELGKISDLISKKQLLLSLMNERINSEVLWHVGRSQIVQPTSGIPALPIRRVLTKAVRPPMNGVGIITAYRDGQVTERSLRRADGYTISATTDTQGQYVHAGDVVVHGLDGFAGAIGTSEASANCSPVYHACVPKEGNDAHFQGRMLRLLALQGYLGNFATSTRERAVDFRNWELFGRIPIPVVPFLEQERVGREILRMRPLRRAIELSEKLAIERRQALITAAVTGQFDVSTASGRNVTDGV